MNKAPNAHSVRAAIEKAVLANGGDAAIVEGVMGALNDMRIVAYRDEGEVPVLTAAGRVLSVLLQFPDVSLKELSTMLGTTESSAQRSITSLVQSGLVSRRKVQGRNRYRVDHGKLASHSDIARFYLAIDDFLS